MTRFNDSKILVDKDQSERHPDVSVYLADPPETKDVWSKWVPAIVVEVVSKGSIDRDYEIKPAEYLEFGIDEYWIVDVSKNQMTVHTRWRGRWKTSIVGPPQKHAPLCLPNFALDLKQVFTAAK